MRGGMSVALAYNCGLLYTHSMQDPKYAHEYYLRHRAAKIKYAQQYAAAHKEEKRTYYRLRARKLWQRATAEDKQRKLAAAKEWKRTHREHVNAYKRRYYAEHREKSKASIERSHAKHRDKLRIAKAKYIRIRYATDLAFRLKRNLASRIRHALKGTTRKAYRTIALVGCPVDVCIRHLERQFTKRMTWTNWGTVWEIDHIRPVAAFDLTDVTQQRTAFNYLNMRPLLKSENHKKQAKRLYLI